VVQFSHFSVKEYLTSDRLARSSVDVSRYHIVLEPAHTILAQACLGVLLRLDDRVDEHNVGDIPLVNYAAQYWVNHAQFEKVAPRIRDSMEYFFDADKPHWPAWCRVQRIDRKWLWFDPEESEDAPDVFPLYYVSLGGFYDLVEHLVGKHPEHINAKGGQMVTPLVAALSGKHFEVAELLHRNGADIDVRDSAEDTPLREACQAGILDIVQWLLNHGADANAQGPHNYPPLIAAAYHGHLEEVQVLIEHSADIHIRDRFSGMAPLHAAAGSVFGTHRDRVDIMQVLLDHGAIIDAEDNNGRTPLQLALEEGGDDVATWLKEHGATR
jgi:ankyrin repeat protein